MTKKEYRNCRIAATMILCLTISWSMQVENGFIAAIAVLATLLFLNACRKKVKEVLFDERDLQIAGKATRISISIFGIVGSIVALLLMGFDHLNSSFQLVGQTIAFSVCILLIINNIIYVYYHRKGK